MPRKPIRPRKVNQKLTPDQVHHLFFSWILDDCHHPFYKIHGDMGFPFENEEHRRRCYFENKEFLFSLIGKGRLPDFFCEFEPGKKPQAYFDYEAKVED